ncbi:MAG: hypothetical protein NVS3B3_15740 [Aquirhabdus sp.]
MRINYTNGACALLACLAVETGSANQAGPAGDPQYFVEGLACQSGKYGLRLPATLPGLLALGPRPAVKGLGTQRWKGYTTTYKRIRFDGLSMDLITYSNDPNRYSLASLTIRSTAWTMLAPFAVGESVDDIRARFGDVAKDDWQLRSIYSGENESVHFDTRAGRVSAIIYECYTG